MTIADDDRIIAMREVMKKTSLSRSSLWRLGRDPKSSFPAPIRLSANRIGFSKAEVDAWLDARKGR